MKEFSSLASLMNVNQPQRTHFLAEIQCSPQVGHDLHLLAFAMQIIESQLLARHSDIMDAPRKAFGHALESRPGLYLAFYTILVDI
jgi:hypothetical protein